MKLTEEQKEAIELFKTNKDGLKTLKELVEYKSNEKVRSCRLARDKEVVIKGKHRNEVQKYTAAEEIKGNLEYIEGMEWVLGYLTGKNL